MSSMETIFQPEPSRPLPGLAPAMGAGLVGTASTQPAIHMSSEDSPTGEPSTDQSAQHIQIEPSGLIEPSDCGCGCGGKGKKPDAEKTGDCGCGCGGKGKAGEPQKPVLVYALGKLGYDFGTEARRDSLMQTMDPAANNPLDPGHWLQHLASHPYEASSVIWTLNLDATPIYAIHPMGPYGAEAYERLREALARN